MSIEHSPQRQDKSPWAKDTPVLDGYLTTTECAAELGINPRTLERWHRLREAPPRTTIGKKIYYRRAAVADWLRSREQMVDSV